MGYVVMGLAMVCLRLVTYIISFPMCGLMSRGHLCRPPAFDRDHNPPAL